MVNVIKNGTLVTVGLDRAITLHQWIRVRGDVSNAFGVRIVNEGNRGPDHGEEDRLTVIVSCGDFDQNGRVLPLDKTRFRRMYLDPPSFTNPKGVRKDYVDINRDGNILLSGNTVWRMSFNGWLLEKLPARS